MVCSPLGSSVHGIFQARILEWVGISFSKNLPNPEIEPVSPALTGGFFTTELREARTYTHTHSLLGSFPIELSFIFLRPLTRQYYEPRPPSALLPIHPSIHQFHQRSSSTSTSQRCGSTWGETRRCGPHPLGAQPLMEPSDKQSNNLRTS